MVKDLLASLGLSVERDAAVPRWINGKQLGWMNTRIFFLSSSWSLSRVTGWTNTTGKQHIYQLTVAIHTIQPLDAQNRREREAENSYKGANTATCLNLWSPMWSGHDAVPTMSTACHSLLHNLPHAFLWPTQSFSLSMKQLYIDHLPHWHLPQPPDWKELCHLVTQHIIAFCVPHNKYNPIKHLAHLFVALFIDVEKWGNGTLNIFAWKFPWTGSLAGYSPWVWVGLNWSNSSCIHWWEFRVLI